MELIELGYWGLFLAAFLAATILPFSSEVIFTSMLLAGFQPEYCLIIATVGNSLGGLTNYIIGYQGNLNWLLKLGMSPLKLENFKKSTSRYGHWLGLLSWIPIIGDPLTLALGYFRVAFVPFLLLMILGKFARYFVIYAFL